MTEELKPCPFCDGKEVKLFKEGSIWVVECLQCLAKVGATAEADVLDFWNYRPIEDKLHGKIGELEAENKRLIGALKAIKKIVDKPPLSIYDAAQIYAECCEALGVKE